LLPSPFSKKKEKEKEKEVGYVVIKLLITTGKQTDLDDCANAFVALAKNSSMTGQSVQIGGWRKKKIFFLFSFSGIFA